MCYCFATGHQFDPLGLKSVLCTVGVYLQTVYKVTVKKLLHGFGFIRRAFKVPTTEEGHDLDCLRDVSITHEHRVITSGMGNSSTTTHMTFASFPCF